MKEGYQPKAPKNGGKLTPPSTGSNVQTYKHPEMVGRKAGGKMVLQVLDTLETSVNRYVNDYDPCPLCANKTEKGYGEPCSTCAYFYAGQFKARRN